MNPGLDASRALGTTAATDQAAAAHVFESNDGTRLAYYIWGEPEASLPVVLHHGFAASSQTNWVDTGIVDALRAAGRGVISLDARGHGRSDKPRAAERYGELRMAGDLVGLLDHLGIAEFDLFGYSMGAVTSLLVASEDTRVRRLVVGGIGEGVLVSGGVDLRVMNREAVVAALLTDDPSTITAPGVAALRAFAEATASDLVALAAQARRMHDQAIELARIAAATLVLAGDKDALAIHPERLARAIPRGSCITVPGDHLGVVRQAAFIEAAVRFLND